MKPNEIVPVFTGQAPYMPIPTPPEGEEFEIDPADYCRDFKGEGFRLYIEVIRPGDEVIDGEQMTKMERFDVTDMAESDLLDLIAALKDLFPDAVRFQAHFCGHAIAKRCIVKPIEG